MFPGIGNVRTSKITRRFGSFGGVRGYGADGKNLIDGTCVGQGVTMMFEATSTGRAGAHDPAQEFRVFVASTQKTLLRVALGLTLDRGHAEDLVQTAYLRTYARWSKLREEDPAAYARRIVVNEHTDRWRRHKGRESLTDAIPESTSYDDPSGVAERDAVLRALAELPDRERKVVVLRYLADLSEADTAATLGVPIGTVKSVTHRAVAKLRASAHLQIDDDEVTS